MNTDCNIYISKGDVVKKHVNLHKNSDDESLPNPIEEPLPKDLGIEQESLDSDLISRGALVQKVGFVLLVEDREDDDGHACVEEIE